MEGHVFPIWMDIDGHVFPVRMDIEMEDDDVSSLPLGWTHKWRVLGGGSVRWEYGDSMGESRLETKRHAIGGERRVVVLSWRESRVVAWKRGCLETKRV